MSNDEAEASERFRDPRVHIYSFADEVRVRCPACGQCAVVYSGRDFHDHGPDGMLRRRHRMHCGRCGFFREKISGIASFGGPVDPYFELPLWLRTETCGHVLWAYNVLHLDLLEAYVGARLRERGRVVEAGPTSMLERLPTWLKSAKNRSQIMRAIAQMRASTPRT